MNTGSDTEMNAPAKTEDFASSIPANVYAETVLSVTHYTGRLFRFTMTRPQGFRFRSGEFAMIGLMVEGKPVFRVYSIASPAWAEELEFFSTQLRILGVFPAHPRRFGRREG